MDLQTRLARAKTKLITHWPFFGSLVLNLNVHIDDRVPTMGTNGKDLYLNEEFCEGLSDDEFLGVLAHEGMHVAWKHMLRIGDRDARKANIAMDVAINDMLVAEGISLPPGGYWSDNNVPGDFRNMNWEQIYELLPEDTGQGQGEGNGEGDIHVMPSEGLSEDQKKEVEAECDRMLKVAAETAKSQGKLPAGVKEMINELMEPKVCWKEMLRRTVLGDHPEDFSYRRPNRRSLGRGLYLPSVHRESVGNVVVVLDTSGSVSNRELQAFLSEVQAIGDECNPSRITIINADTEVNKIDVFEGGVDVHKYEVDGRGGTDMFPSFKYIEENLLHDLQAVICMSDMEFWWPSEDQWPTLFDVLWVSSGSRKHDFGTLVKLDV